MSEAGRGGDAREIERLRARVAELEALLDTPVYDDFLAGVKREAGHQRQRWGATDAEKGPAEWFWTLGYLAGKALAAARDGNVDKALHHTISSSAMLLNWHRHLQAGKGVDKPAGQSGT